MVEPNGFSTFLFKYKNENKLSMSEAQSVAGDLWKNMSEEQRLPYKTKSKSISKIKVPNNFEVKADEDMDQDPPGELEDNFEPAIPGGDQQAASTIPMDQDSPGELKDIIEPATSGDVMEDEMNAEGGFVENLELANEIMLQMLIIAASLGDN